jgi:hypothetical protein
MESEYVYVVEGRDLFKQQLPVVVRGLDVAMGAGDQALVFSLLASKENYDQAVAAFRGFVKKSRLE